MKIATILFTTIALSFCVVYCESKNIKEEYTDYSLTELLPTKDIEITGSAEQALYYFTPNKSKVCQDLANKNVFVNESDICDFECDRIGYKKAVVNVESINEVEYVSKPYGLNKYYKERKHCNMKCNYELVGNNWVLKTIE